MRPFPQRTKIPTLAASLAVLTLLVAFVTRLPWTNPWESRVATLTPGLIRGAWQSPAPLRRILAREHIRTVVTLTAINPDDPKYLNQAPILKQAGVDWVFIPMRGSTATLDQMAEAADLLNDPARRPLFFHCVAGHHRTSLAHAAWLIRHRGASAENAWTAIARLPWSRPEAPADQRDRAVIQAFAQREAQRQSPADRPGDVPCRLTQRTP